jgi:hypothetical protein
METAKYAEVVGSSKHLRGQTYAVPPGTCGGRLYWNSF